MCGICGLVDFSQIASAEKVRQMSSRLLHRGPDAQGIHIFPHCALGHTRLSILDLSNAANQPMISDDSQVAVVFNGEIYNFREIRARLENMGHKFRTQSDTEVILALYLEKQETMLDELNGMFAFAIWDEPKQSLFFARDRVGKKPFYYFTQNGVFLWSSELDSLKAAQIAPLDVDNQALFEYFLYDFIPAPQSIYKHIHKLPAGHYGSFDKKGLTCRQYWNLPSPEPSLNYKREKNRLESLIRDAVELRMISDVPLGAFLSGGIDSSLITSMMTQLTPAKVQTFSIAFPGTTHDESKWSGLAAARLGTAHSESEVDMNIRSTFKKIALRFGEPFADSSALPTWHLCKETRKKVTVALSGDGGDELFGGYDRYLARKIQVLYDRMPAAFIESVVEPAIDRLPATTDYYGTSIVKKLKLFSLAARRMRHNPEALIPRTFSIDEVTRLTGVTYDMDLDPVIEMVRKLPETTPVLSMMFADIQSYMVEDILTKVDRMSMDHALEVRSPLLDYRVVEAACRLPLNFKLKGMTTKAILKDIAGAYVPREIIQRPKYGFQIPLGEWLKTKLREWAKEILFSSSNGKLDQDIVSRIWENHQSGRQDNSHKLWSILMFKAWPTYYS